MQAPEHVSLLVIGGGITGLSTAITWALNNPTDAKPVLLVEKQAVLGGYVTSFRRQGYLFDTVQIIPESSDVLSYMGIDVDLVKFDGYYARIFLADTTTHSAISIEIPSGLDAFKAFLLARYPDQARSINQFFDYSLAMFDELYHLKVEPNFF